MTTTAKVRYAVVGLGHIAQAAVLPAFDHARKNSELVALVSDDPEKLDELSRRYQVSVTGSYDEYERCLQQVDAVFIALPNSQHAEFAVRAARAGVHVLCEKPMATTASECEEMIEACRDAGVRLMIAYRLHFDRTNLRAIGLVQSDTIGAPKFYTASFSMKVVPGGIRTQAELGGGTLYDIGVYCINAARYIFQAEPREVFAFAVNSRPEHLAEVDESTGAVLRFDGERVATFVTSFNAADTSWFRVVGERGDLLVEPAFEYAEGLAYQLTVNGRRTRRSFRKRDQFAPELLYFSDCVLRDREPEPSGHEGLQDIRIVEALLESTRIGRAIALPPYEPAIRPGPHQDIWRPPVQNPELVNTRSPTE
jgi:glucose-fructose oxidoreductase